MTYRGHVKNGVIVLDEAVAIPEGSEVDVNPVAPAKSQLPLGKTLLKFAGIVEGLPEDLALNHDHYLYGVPKK